MPADVVNTNDVRVMQRCREVRLVPEHPYELGILREVGKDPFEYDDVRPSVRAGGLGEVELRHPSDGQTTQQLVLIALAAAHGADRQRGILVRIHGGFGMLARLSSPRQRADK